MKKGIKNRARSALPGKKKINVNKSIDFSKKVNRQRIPSAFVGAINNKNINNKNSEDLWLKNFFERDKKLFKNKFRIGLNNNREKVKGRENNRYKNIFNQPIIKVNKNFNIKSQDIFPNINNQKIDIKKIKNNKLLFSQEKPKKPIIMPVNNVNNINIMNINMNKNLVNNFFDGKIKNISFENNKINKFNFNRNIKNNKINIKLNINRGQSKDNKNIQSANNQKPPSILTQQKFILLNKTNANGLANIGATCYMNATLQCLAHIQKLTYHFLNSDTKKKLYLNKVKYRLSLAYVTVLENLWQNNKEKYYSPNGFKDVISAMNPLFAGIQANDSKDLILFILETMHKELNIEKDDNKKILDNDIDSPNAQYNYEITFKKFSIFFRNSFNSVISNLFYGMFNSMMNCQNCHIIIYNVQCFNILIFPLQEVKKYKMKYIDIVDIYECFDYYQRPDYMGGKSFYCNNCRQMVDNINTTKILYGPRILVINLNRGKGLEFDIKLNFPEYIDISNYVYYKDKSPTYYELIGIVTHFGPSSMSGHFIAFCKSFGNQQWYKYNDAMVDLSNFEEAKNTGVPYILFYSYIKR